MKWKPALLPLGAVASLQVFLVPEWAGGSPISGGLPGFFEPPIPATNVGTLQQNAGTRGSVLLGFFTNPMHPVCVDECGLAPPFKMTSMKCEIPGPSKRTVFKCTPCIDGITEFQQFKATWMVDEAEFPGELCMAAMR